MWGDLHLLVYRQPVCAFFMTITTHAYLRTLPVRTGERFCADEVFGAAGRSSCLFSVTGLQTRFCLAHKMADRKDGHNAIALLEMAKDRTGKVP